MEDDVPWRGVHISQLQTSLNHSLFPELISNEEHTILFRIPVLLGKVPQCYPSIFNKRDFWDDSHVKLPCSEKNVTRDQVNRWNLTRNALTCQILSSEQLQAAILNYNSRYAKQWDFSALHSFFEDVFDEMETMRFFDTLLPKIIDRALRLPELVTGGIPLLKRGHQYSVSLSQLQISCLLSNAFLCTFPHRNSIKRNAEYFDYPDINFNRLFQCDNKDRIQSVHEKIKCILNYFRRVTNKIPTGGVTYSRQFVSNNLYPNWSNSSKKLPRLFVSSDGTIEDDGFGLFQVDFANKFVGGGVIGTGCVQEEIRFVICPELILSRLFTQCLGENEALVVTGCERFNKYKGYGSSFEWDGDYVDGTPSDENGRKYCTVIALDALYFRQNPLDQYLPKNILRDINKAYVGFSWGSRRKREELCAVATGNWGCGAFKGDPKLKSFLQLMAAGEVGRDLAYFTFGDEELRDGMAAVHKYLVDNEVTIGKLYSLLWEYNSKQLFKTVGLFDFFRSEALKKSEAFEMECDIPQLNVSNGLRQLQITKKRSFCCRTKVSDWFSPVNQTSFSRKDDELKVDDVQLASEKQILRNFYRFPMEKPAGTNAPSETESSQYDCFEFLNKFKNSLKQKTLMVNCNDGKSSSSTKGYSRKVTLNKSENIEDIDLPNNGDGGNLCPDEEIVDRYRLKTNIDREDDLRLTSRNSNSNLLRDSELVQLSKSVSAQTKSASKNDNVKKTVGEMNLRNDSMEWRSPGIKPLADGTLSTDYKSNVTLETEKSEEHVSESSNYFSEESAAENVARIDCHAPSRPETEGVEKENLNQNRIRTLSSLASRQKQNMNTPKRSTSSSSPKNNDHDSKKRKISDYFSTKIL